MGARIARLILAHPAKVMILGLLMTIGLLFGATRWDGAAGKLRWIVVPNDNLKEVIPHDSPVRITLNDLEALFGSSETIVLTIRPTAYPVFSSAVLIDVMKLTRKLQRTQGVHRVQSLATADRIYRDDEGGLRVEKILSFPPRTTEAVAAVRRHVFDDDNIRQAFLSADEGALALYIDPRPTAADADLLAGIRKAIEEVIPGYETHLTGLPPIRQATNQTIMSDLLTLVPVVSLVLMIVLYLSLRTVSGVILTLLTVGFSIAPAIGVMGLLEIPLSSVTNTFPILVLAIACGDAIHLLSLYYQRLRAGVEKTAAIRQSVEELALPILLTSVTSAAGFLSMLTSPMPPIGGLGILVAFGIMWAWLLSTFILPVALTLLPAPHLRVTAAEEERAASRLDAVFDRIIGAVTRHRLVTAVVALAGIGLLAGVGLPMIKREVAPERMFPVGHLIRSDAEAIDADFRSSSPIEILVKGDARDPEILAAVDSLKARLRAEVPEIGSVDSIAGIVRRMNANLTGSDELPRARDQIAQLILLFGNGSPDRLKSLVATDWSALRVTVRLPNLETERLNEVVGIVERTVGETMGDVPVAYTGKAPMNREMAGLVVDSSLSSILFSTLLVLIICAIAFRHLLDGIEGMIPLAFAILGVFGIMGLVGIPLTTATAIISSIVIGVGIDYGIHVLARWNLVQKMHFESHQRQIHETIHDVGRPVLFNASAVAGGLSVLSLSHFEPIGQLGVLAVIAMFASALGALILIPTIKTFRRKGVSS